MSAYQLPTVWQDEASNQGAFTGLNKPTAGARFEQNLPKGEQAFQLYSLGTPNGVKVTILLEELLEAGFKETAYDLYKIAIMDGDQFGSDFVKLNPNSKIPALLDQSGTEEVRVFESASSRKTLPRFCKILGCLKLPEFSKMGRKNCQSSSC